ncbi:SGNH/GDSL hydrolase family protein [Glaciecola petra]|uniref:SGNH hydrolase-type esterase domain-containing protein n=1 Tax=Glaciecola petra TaxID=3075602 RepID=A0ABU2ZQZ2_9ALTE|nr:hypothetical protein [Aestuariibacter sp. P117]MDT0594458.1 hypothetical protein [Aestuariibacter sp. P117]
MNKPKTQLNKAANRKHFVFYIIAFLIPLIFVLAFEGTLRLIGFGKSHELFVANPANNAYLLATPNIMDRYFPFSQNKPSVSLETDFFLANKPENGFRVVVQGGSSAAGFPYGLGASIAGTLEQRLRQSMPEHHVEVINTAMSAVNSFTLLDMADQIIAQQPDMVLIYAGHNEFLGILGASSNFSLANGYWLTRTKLYLKDFRTFQLFQWIYAQFERGNQTAVETDKNNFEKSRTMMAKVAQNQNIEYASPVYQAGLHQFETNLNALLNKYAAANIPVLLSSIASNYQHQQPLASLPIEATNKQVLDNMQKQQTLSIKDYQKISRKFTKSQSANLHFQFAQRALKANARDIALMHFELAIQHDLLKFRAPKEINSIINKLLERDGVHFVDSFSLLSNRSPQQIIGNSLMLEHLHPKLQAYYLISEAFYQQLKQVVIRHQPRANWRDIAIEQTWRQRLVLPSEEYNAYATIENLTSHYPFVENSKDLSLSKPTNKPQELGLAYFQKTITWLEMMEDNLAYYQDTKNLTMVLKTTQILADALPHNGLYNIQAAEILAKLKENELAIYYYKRALRAGAVDGSIQNKINNLATRKR